MISVKEAGSKGITGLKRVRYIGGVSLKKTTEEQLERQV